MTVEDNVMNIEARAETQVGTNESETTIFFTNRNDRSAVVTADFTITNPDTGFEHVNEEFIILNLEPVTFAKIEVQERVVRVNNYGLDEGESEDVRICIDITDVTLSGD